MGQSVCVAPFPQTSVAQCKERYHFLIEPKIWTQSEDEKLINLVKVYDPLWTTIGALMGRPPNSCHSRYHLAKEQKLIGDLKGSRPMLSNKRKAGEMGEYVFLPGETEKTFQAGTSVKPTTKAAKVKAHPTTLGKKPKMEKNTACMKTKVQLD